MMSETTQSAPKSKSKIFLCSIILGICLVSALLMLIVTSKSQHDEEKLVTLRVQESTESTLNNLPMRTTTAKVKCDQCLYEHPCYVPPEVPLSSELNCDLMSDDGFCDDLCNHPEQNFDGGDCCLDYIDITYCTECYCYNDCSEHPNDNCFEENPKNPTFCKSGLITDTLCDDECNFPEFNYDGGDCCLDLVHNIFCSHCFCYEDCSVHDLEILDYSILDYYPSSTTTTMANVVRECYVANPIPYINGSCTPVFRGDTFCDDVCNVPELQFDGGDCCLDEINNAFCSFCFCYQDCTFHPENS